MKIRFFTPKPGELFAWHYDKNDKLCHPRESFLSTPMNHYVPTVGVNFLISLTDTDMWWLNNNRLIHAFVRDMVLFSVLSDRDGNEFIHPRHI